jgi:hypothetical protein
MQFVTISDHNCIAGALEIAHLPGTFLSTEVTTYFSEDVVGIEQNHERVVRFFAPWRRARFLSASRIFRPSSKICCITSSPLNAPIVLRQAFTPPPFA